MKKLLFLLLLPVFAKSQLIYQKITTPSEYGYLLVDSALSLQPGDTLLKRAPSTKAIIRYKSSNNTFYGYYPNTGTWRPLAIDSAGIIGLLNQKVDSVTVAGDSLFYWKLGVAFGYILPTAGWRTDLNVGDGTDKFGFSNNHNIDFYANNVRRMTLDNRGNLGIGTAAPTKPLDVVSVLDGVLFPRMTTANRNAILTPLTSEWIYNTSTNQYNYYNGATWSTIGATGTETWESVLTNSATLLTDHAVTNNGHTFTLSGDNGSYRNVLKQGSDNNMGFFLRNTSSAELASISTSASDTSVTANSISGKYKIKNVPAGSAVDSLLSYQPASNRIFAISPARFITDDWHTEGNSGTDTADNFIGTLDGSPLGFRVSNNKMGWLESANNTVSFGLGSYQPKGSSSDIVAMGRNALQSGTDMYDVIAVGTDAQKNLHDGSRDIAIGKSALLTNVSGSDNAAFGNYAGAYLVDPTNVLVINGIDRNTAKGDSLDSPIFIEQDVAASQKIYLNGKLYDRYLTSGSPTDSIVTWSHLDSQFHRINVASIGGVSAPNTEIVYGTGSGVGSSSDFTFDGALLSSSSNINFFRGGAGLYTDDIIGISKLGDWFINQDGNVFVINDQTHLAYYDNPIHDGKFGINTSTPSYSLHVIGEGKFDNVTSGGIKISSFLVGDEAGIYGYEGFDRLIAGFTNYSGLFTFADGKIVASGIANGLQLNIIDSINSVTVDNSGHTSKVGINTTTPGANLDVVGTFQTSGVNTLIDLSGTGSRAVIADASGELSAPISDARKKKNLLPIANYVDVIGMLRNPKIHGIFYNWIDPKRGKEQEIGFTAQMFESVQGLTGTMTNTGDKYLNYDRISALLWEQNRLQQVVIDNQEARLKKLEAQNKSLAKQFAPKGTPKKIIIKYPKR